MRDTLDRTLRHVVVALLIIALASVLTSCTDASPPGDGRAAADGSPPVSAPATTPAGGEGSSVGTSTPSETPTDDADPVAAASVDVSAFEFGFTASAESVPAGEVTFTLVNTGGMDHDLVLEGVQGAATALVPPTGTGTFTVTLEPGVYVLYCSVGQHRSLGMEIEITVT